jgi:HSP20 family protein
MKTTPWSFRPRRPASKPATSTCRVSDNRLVLRASKKVETKDEKGKIQEYREQKCYESVTLPSGIDKEKVEAKYHNGVLTVRLPKTSEGKGRHIPVKST